METIYGYLRLYGTFDGVVHWCYPAAGLLLVCGERLDALPGDRPWPDPPPTCIRCIHIVQTKREYGESW